MDLLNCFNLNQHTVSPTPRSDHTLDLIITRSDENFVSNLSVHDPITLIIVILINLRLTRR